MIFLMGVCYSASPNGVAVVEMASYKENRMVGMMGRMQLGRIMIVFRQHVIKHTIYGRRGGLASCGKENTEKVLSRHPLVFMSLHDTHYTESSETSGV